jgi:hypothetical protein
MRDCSSAGMPGCHADGELPIGRRDRYTNLTHVREFYGVANLVEQRLRQPLFIAKSERQGLGHLGLHVGQRHGL